MKKNTPELICARGSEQRREGLDWYDPHVIYVLEDPLQGNEVFYVGMTRDLSERFIQHLRDDKGDTPKCRRIRHIKSRSLIPRARVIDCRYTREDAERTEAMYIEYYRAAGVSLTNTAFSLFQDGFNGQAIYVVHHWWLKKTHTWSSKVREALAACWVRWLRPIVCRIRAKFCTSPDDLYRVYLGSRVAQSAYQIGETVFYEDNGDIDRGKVLWVCHHSDLAYVLECNNGSLTIAPYYRILAAQSPERQKS